MTFLERARTVARPGMLAKLCWPEILAVVEAAQKATVGYEEEFERNPEWSQMEADALICDALDALNKKAGEG